jgi:hypothetical protein
MIARMTDTIGMLDTCAKQDAEDEAHCSLFPANKKKMKR